MKSAALFRRAIVRLLIASLLAGLAVALEHFGVTWLAWVPVSVSSAAGFFVALSDYHEAQRKAVLEEHEL